MGDELDALIPRIGKNYLVSRIEKVPNGAYKELYTDRPCILFPLSVSTVGQCLIYAGAMPPSDTVAIPIPAGNAITLDGVGKWYIKTGSSQTENFLQVDGGQAGNLSAIAGALGVTAGNINVNQWGGTAQTGFDFGAAAKNRAAWKTDQLISVSASSILAYATSRVVPDGKKLGFGALPANVGKVYVCDAAGSKGSSIVLSPGQPGGALYVTNWNLVNIFSDNVGDGIWLGAEV